MLDVGLAFDPVEVWLQIMETISMEPVWTDEVCEVIDRAFQKKPEIMWRFPTVRKFLEDGEREAERNAQLNGERIGEMKARQDDLLRLMAHKFGELPAAVVSRVESTADIEALKAWMVRLLDARSLAEMGLDEDV